MMILTSGWVGIHPHLLLATRAHICLDSITLLLRVPGRSSPLPLQPEQRKKSSVPHCWACLFVASSPPPWWRGQQLQSLGLESDIQRMSPLGIRLMFEDWGDWSREGSPSYLSWDTYTVSSGSLVCLWMAPDGLFGTGPQHGGDCDHTYRVCPRPNTLSPQHYHYHVAKWLSFSSLTICQKIYRSHRPPSHGKGALFSSSLSFPNFDSWVHESIFFPPLLKVLLSTADFCLFCWTKR